MDFLPSGHLVLTLPGLQIKTPLVDMADVLERAQAQVRIPASTKVPVQLGVGYLTLLSLHFLISKMG